MDDEIFEIQEEKGDKADLKGKYSISWVEESFSFGKNTGKQVRSLQTKNYLGKSLSKKRILIFFLLILSSFCIILGRVGYLQIVKGNHYRDLAEGNRVRINPILAERGIIYDKNGKELVQNIPSFSLTLIPQDLPKEKFKRQQIINQVVNLSGVDVKEITSLLDKYGSYSYASLVIKENLDYDSALKLYIKSADLPGISIEKGSKRKYLLNDENRVNTTTLSLSHILGYLSKLTETDYKFLQDKGYLLFDRIGKTGLEKTYESELRGEYGRKRIEVDASGHEKNLLAEKPPSPGKNIHLGLDLDAQAKLEILLENMWVKF